MSECKLCAHWQEQDQLEDKRYGECEAPGYGVGMYVYYEYPLFTLPEFGCKMFKPVEKE